MLGIPGGSAGRVCKAGGLGSIPGLGRSPGEGNGYPIQYSGLENSMDCPWGYKELDTTEQLSCARGIGLGRDGGGDGYSTKYHVCSFSVVLLP